MECQNKIVTIVTGALVGIFVVAVLIFSVTFGINMALAPVVGALKDVGVLNARVAALEGDIKALKQGGAGRQAPAPAPEDFNKVYDIPVGGSYVLGKADAKVTIMEFSDIQCPFCARFHPVLGELRKAFPDDVKIIFKNFPLAFHPNARPAAKAALAAGLQGKYYEMLDILMQNNTDLSEAKYKEYAGKIGLNVEQFTADLKDKDADFEKAIEADVQLGAKSDVRGTPTYFVNGKKTMARDVKAWTEAVQEALKK